jgi:hypothetical protein
MKTRNGFVSNSSSSSFLFVGYTAVPNPKTEVNWKVVCEANLSKREINEYAVANLNDDNYEHPENWTENFWKQLAGIYDLEEETLYDIPDGLTLIDNVYGKMYIGIEFGGAQDLIHIDSDKFVDSIRKVKMAAPKKANIQIIAGFTSEG